MNATIVLNAGELECGANISIYSLALSEAETFIASVHFEEHGSYALKMEHPPEEFMDPTCEGDRCTTPSTMMRDAEGNFIDSIVSEPSDAPSTDGNEIVGPDLSIHCHSLTFSSRYLSIPSPIEREV